MGVAVFGVIKARGVTLTTVVGVVSCVGVWDFKPTRVGVDVNVDVGVMGVAVGTGVRVFVGTSEGVGVAPTGRVKPPTEQDNDRIAQAKIMFIFFMALRWGILLKVHSTCKVRGW